MLIVDISIQIEQPEHAGGVDAVERAAFGRAGEADLVKALREREAVSLALVALAGGQVVGHVLFSPVRFEQPGVNLKIAGLGPLAVLPEMQRQGVGKRLIAAGLDALRRDETAAVFVLGDPAYYGRFGFKPARLFNLVCAYDHAGDAFQVIELGQGSLAGRQGLVLYHPEFDRV